MKKINKIIAAVAMAGLLFAPTTVFADASPQLDGVASLYITSNDPVNAGRKYIESSPDHSLSASGSLVLKNEQGNIEYEGAFSKIKGRGNSTWRQAKKPYQITLSKKAALIGSSDNAAKKWILLSNSFDVTDMHEFVAHQFGLRLGLDNTPEVRYVNLYYDGEYRGLYLLSEKVEVGSGRVEGKEIKNKSADSTDLEKHSLKKAKNKYGYEIQYTEGVANPLNLEGTFIVEHDTGYSSDERAVFQTSIGAFVVKEPENCSKEQMLYISEKMQDGINIASTSDGNIYEKFDVDSLVKTFLVNHLTANPDCYRWSSTYYYVTGTNSPIYAGPLWDFDRAFGTHSYFKNGEYNAESLFMAEYAFFWNNSIFRSELAAETPEAIRIARLLNIDEIYSRIKSSVNEDIKKWGVVIQQNDKQFSSVNAAISYFKSFFSQRLNYMEKRLTGLQIYRYGGATRYETNQKVIFNVSNSADGVVIVSGEGYADAISAIGLAGVLEYPIVLSSKDKMNNTTYNTIKSLHPKEAIIIGSTGALSSKVENQAKELTGKVTRIGGTTRFETSYQIYQYGKKNNLWATTQIILTNGQGFADALSISPLAYRDGIPIILTDGNKGLVSTSTMSAEKAYSEIRNHVTVIAMGSSSVMSDKLINRLKKDGVEDVVRLAGATRYDTSIATCKYLIDEGFTTDFITLGNGTGFADNLSSSYLTGRFGTILLLVDGKNISTNKKAKDFLKSRDDLNSIYIIGGSGAISEAVVNNLF